VRLSGLDRVDEGTEQLLVHSGTRRTLRRGESLAVCGGSFTCRCRDSGKQ